MNNVRYDPIVLRPNGQSDAARMRQRGAALLGTEVAVPVCAEDRRGVWRTGVVRRGMVELVAMFNGGHTLVSVPLDKVVAVTCTTVGDRRVASISFGTETLSVPCELADTVTARLRR